MTKTTSIPELLKTFTFLNGLAVAMDEDRLYITEFQSDHECKYHRVIDHGDHIPKVKDRYQLMHVTAKNRITRYRK